MSRTCYSELWKLSKPAHHGMPRDRLPEAIRAGILAMIKATPHETG
jgi:hypothetical protein